MNTRTKQWLTGCGIGCGVFVLIAVVAGVGGSFVLMGKFKDAIAAREILEEVHGSQADYIPSADGVIDTQRIEAFLEVRSAAMEVCPEFEQMTRQFSRMDNLSEDASHREIFGEVMSLSKEVFRMMPRLGGFFRARNMSLLEVDMGLGEYTYIYTLAYHDQLLDGCDDAVFGSPDLGQRIHAALRQMMENQLGAMNDRLAVDDAGLVAWRDTLRREVEHLRDDPERLPWQDGLPPRIAAAIEPFQRRLDAVYCAATMGLEFTRNRQRGLSIRGD